MTGVVGAEDLRRPSAKHYPNTWNVLGETLEPLLETLFSDVETPQLYEAVEAVERVVDALESSLADVQRMQVRVSAAEQLAVPRPSIDVVDAADVVIAAEQSLRVVEAETVAEATRFRWHFMVGKTPVYLTPFPTLGEAKAWAVAFLALWHQEYPNSDARSVVSDFGDDPEGEIIHDFAGGGELDD